MIADDIPGHFLRLVWSGERPGKWLRRISSLLIAILLVFWINLVLYVIDALGGNAPPKRDDVLMPGVMAFMSLILLYYGASFAGLINGYWHEFAWDAANASFTARRRGWLFWGNKSVLLPFDKIRWFSLDFGPEGQFPLPAKLQISAGEPLHLSYDLSSLNLTQRSDGEQLLFSLARVMNAEGYRIHANTARELSLQVWRKHSDYAGTDEPNDDEEDETSEQTDFRPIPDPHASITVEPIRKPRVEDTVRASGPVDLPTVEKTLDIVRIDTWRPGELVRIIRPRAPWFVYALVLVIALVPAGLLGRAFVFNILRSFFGLEETHRQIVAGFTVLLTGCAIGFLLWNNLKVREVIFDWSRNRLTLRYGSTLRHWPFAAVQELLLAEKTHGESFADAEDNTPAKPPDGYKAGLHLLLPEEDILVIETEKWEPLAAVARQTLAPMGSALAAALRMRYSRGNPKGRPGKEAADALRMSRPQLLTLALIGLVAASLLGSVAVRDYGIRRTVAQLKELGVDAVFMGSYGHNRHIVLENFVNIRMTDNKLLAAHGEEINRLLATLPKVGLDLRESSLTDADLEPFRGVKLHMVRIAKSPVTDDGLALLASGDDLVFVDADETTISDNCVPALKRLPNLRFMFFRQTRITFRGSAQLHAMPAMLIAEP